jgi:hypothetical protein
MEPIHQLHVPNRWLRYSVNGVLDDLAATGCKQSCSEVLWGQDSVAYRCRFLPSTVLPARPGPGRCLNPPGPPRCGIVGGMFDGLPFGGAEGRVAA